MKSINCWNDLEPFGLIVLTGEACGLSYRLLCDVTLGSSSRTGPVAVLLLYPRKKSGISTDME